MPLLSANKRSAVSSIHVVFLRPTHGFFGACLTGIMAEFRQILAKTAEPSTALVNFPEMYAA